MDFQLSEEQQAVSDVADAVMGRVSASKVDAPPPPTGADWFDRETWHRLAESNLLGISLSEDVGGAGFGLLEILGALVAQGRHLARVPLGVTAAVAAPAIDAFGSAALRSSVLPGVAEGATVLTVALVEPGSYGADTVTTTAIEDDDGCWRLDGVKSNVPFAREADRVLVPATTGQTVRVFAVDLAAPNVTLTDQQTTNGQPECELRLDGVVVDGEDVLGSSSDDVHQWVIDRAVLALCAVQVGVGEQALAMTASYTAAREQFGKPIATFQSVALRAADAFLSVECMRSTLLQAAWLLAEGRPVGQAVDVAKFWASEAGQEVTASAQQLHGGMGVDTDYPLHRYTLWSKLNELSLGSGHVHLARIGAGLAAGAGE